MKENIRGETSLKGHISSSKIQTLILAEKKERDFIPDENPVFMLTTDD